MTLVPTALVCGPLHECHQSGTFWVGKNNEREGGVLVDFKSYINYRSLDTKIHLLSFPTLSSHDDWPWSWLFWSALLFSFTSLVSIKIGILWYINIMKCEYCVIIILIKTKYRYTLVRLLLLIKIQYIMWHLLRTEILLSGSDFSLFSGKEKIRRETTQIR